MGIKYIKFLEHDLAYGVYSVSISYHSYSLFEMYLLVISVIQKLQPFTITPTREGIMQQIKHL